MDAFQRESTAFLSPRNIRDKMRSFQAIPYLSIHGMKEIRVVRVTLKPWFRLFKGFVTGLKRAEMAENIRICFSFASYSLWLSLLSIKTEWTECIGESSAYSKEIEVNRFIRTRNFLRKSTDQKIASRPLIRWLVLESRELLISFWFYNNSLYNGFGDRLAPRSEISAHRIDDTK